MKLNKQIALSLMTASALASAQPVLAQEMTQEQNLKQECEVVCEVGAYGQDTSCTNKCYQEGNQKQSIVLNNGTVVAKHKPINTGLDINTGAAVISMLMTGAVATITRRKLA